MIKTEEISDERDATEYRRSPRLDEWSWVDGDERSERLNGVVYDHPRILDGLYIKTSRVVEITETMAITENTAYVLGRREEE